MNHNPIAEYEGLARRLRDRGRDVDAAESAVAALVIETPSWGYGDSGTRFATFQQPGRPRDVHERLDDAAEVHRLTGTAPAVALHFPWDSVDDLDALRAHLGAVGLRIGAVNPNLFQDPDYKLGSITNPDERVRAKALDHLLECVSIATALGSSAQSLWLADGINYPGQDDLRARRGRLLDSLHRLYAALPQDQELLVEYKPFEPAFYATDLDDWGSALLVCQELGERARVLIDLGHHAQGVNVEQIVGHPRGGGQARRLSLQQPQVRRRRPDRRLGEPVRAFPDLPRAGGGRGCCRVSRSTRRTTSSPRSRRWC